MLVGGGTARIKEWDLSTKGRRSFGRSEGVEN